MKRVVRSAVMPRVAILSGILLYAFAADARAVTSAVIFGEGTESCAAWTSTTPEARLAGSQWVLGFLSGMNVVVPESEQVGRGADVPDLLEKVRSLCQDQPSWPLARAAVWAARGVSARDFDALSAHQIDPTKPAEP